MSKSLLALALVFRGKHLEQSLRRHKIARKGTGRANACCKSSASTVTSVASAVIGQQSALPDAVAVAVARGRSARGSTVDGYRHDGDDVDGDDNQRDDDDGDDDDVDDDDDDDGDHDGDDGDDHKSTWVEWR